jgi:hypothetical protein
VRKYAFLYFTSQFRLEKFYAHIRNHIYDECIILYTITLFVMWNDWELPKYSPLGFGVINYDISPL